MCSLDRAGSFDNQLYTLLKDDNSKKEADANRHKDPDSYPTDGHTVDSPSPPVWRSRVVNLESASERDCEVEMDNEYGFQGYRQPAGFNITTERLFDLISIGGYETKMGLLLYKLQITINIAVN